MQHFLIQNRHLHFLFHSTQPSEFPEYTDPLQYDVNNEGSLTLGLYFSKSFGRL